MTFEIEDDVPFPESRTKSTDFPLKEMEVGKSFLIPAVGKQEKAKAYKNVYNAQKYINRTEGKKFIVRTVEDGVRVWRES